MKKFIKGIIGLIVLISINLNLGGCLSKENIDIFKNIVNLNEKYIVFDDTKVSKQEVLEYESPYKDMTATYFKAKLSEEELVVYQTFIYAYEHEYTSIKYYSEDPKLGDSFMKITQALCAENPFFDWNYTYGHAYNSVENYYEINNTTLDKKDVKLKIQAYNKAKEWIKSIPSNATDYEKLERIYEYVVNNIKYVDELQKYMINSPSYVYDGLVGGKTQCTGFASSMVMLCNLAGIETLSVSGTSLQGHAWNLVKLDGEFYHCDSTNDSGIESQLPEVESKIWLSFLKSDNMLFSTDYSLDKKLKITFPKATNTKYDYENITLSTETISNEQDLNKISQALLENKNYIVTHLPNISAKEDFDVQNVVEYVGTYISNNVTYDREVYISIEALRNPASRDLIIFMKVD